MDDEAAEAVRLARDPVDHVAAVRGAERADALAVEERVLRERVVEALDQVLVGLAAPVVADRVGEGLAVAGRAVEVDHDRRVARAGVGLRRSSGSGSRCRRSLAVRRGSGTPPGTSCRARSRPASRARRARVSPGAPAKLNGSGAPKRAAATRASLMCVTRRSSLPSAADRVQLRRSEQRVARVEQAGRPPAARRPSSPRPRDAGPSPSRRRRRRAGARPGDRPRRRASRPSAEKARPAGERSSRGPSPGAQREPALGAGRPRRAGRCRSGRPRSRRATSRGTRASFRRARSAAACPRPGSS